MPATEPGREWPLCIAVLAIGGQGGGVLCDWLRDLAEEQGWRAQATSVPGVAQRTGATVYYLELFPPSRLTPVLALMPSPGAVDLVIAAELMEAGRAVQRGLVSPERTVLIASSHRSYAVSEKTRPGVELADPAEVLAALEASAVRLVHADLAAIAAAQRSVISAALFGAVAGSGALPFPLSAYLDTIRRGGVGVEASLAAFEAARETIVCGPRRPCPPPARPALAGGSRAEREAYRELRARVMGFPAAARDMLLAGVDATVDYQDCAYGAEYLDQIDTFAALERPSGEPRLTIHAAKYLARAMCYDDIISVADRKTRAARRRRLRRAAEAAAEPAAGEASPLLAVTEFTRPRLEEISALLPPRLGRRLERWQRLRALTDRGRRLRSDRLGGFLLLYTLAGLRRWRRGNLRHQREREHWRAWLASARETAALDYELAVEVLRCRRLVRGYADTHRRGLQRYQRLIGLLPRLRGRGDAALRLRELLDAALADEDGAALESLLAAETPSQARQEPQPGPLPEPRRTAT